MNSLLGSFERKTANVILSLYKSKMWPSGAVLSTTPKEGFEDLRAGQPSLHDKQLGFWGGGGGRI